MNFFLPKKLGFFLLFFIAFDQLAKQYFISQGRAIFNSGIAFGLFPGIDNLVLIILGIITVFLFFLLKRLSLTEIFNRTGAILFLAGAISNLLDRFFYGAVVDYLNLAFLPGFNLADVALVAGVLLFAKESLWPKEG